MKIKNYKKAFMRINLIFIFLLSCIVSAYSSVSYAQKVNLHTRNASIREVFESIRKQTSYNFIYSKRLLEKSRPVTVNLSNVSVKDALEACFEGQPISYKLQGENIVISAKTNDPTFGINTGLQQNISGRVRLKGESGTQYAPGVSIRAKGRDAATSTDANGHFTISAATGDILIISFVGYISREITVKDVTGIEVTLEEQVNELDAVVVTGYTTQEKRSITGAMSSIKKESIENVPVQSFDRAMQGQVSGVNVMAANGVPGGPVRINIRGTGSITAGNEPLIIVDGVQLNTSTSSGQTASNPLAFLNNNDIESIEVLKDGAAASIYGAQAANGVVLVTTKAGKAGKTKVNLNYYNGITSPMPEMKMLNTQQFFQSRLESRNNRYPTRTPERNRADILTGMGFPADMTDEEIAALPTYNWQEAAFRTGHTNNADLSISGGNDKTTFFLSGSYNKTDGNVVSIDFERATAKLGLTHKLTDKLSLATNINLSTITQNGTSGSNGSTGAYAAPQYSAPMILPFIPVYNADGSYNAPIDGFPGSSNRNPIQESVVGTLQSRTKALVSNFSATYQINSKLSFKSFYGIDYRIIDDERYVDPRTRSGAASQGSLTIGKRQNSNFLTNQTLNYKTTFAEDHNLSALLGAEYRYDNREISSVTGTGFTTYQFRSLQSAAIITAGTGSWTGFKRAGVFGQVNYDFQKKYLLSAVLRYDGSSRFGKNNKFGWFPAISAGWNMSEESFLKDQEWINQLKLRVGYGETGNDAIGNFDSRALYGSSSSSNYNQEPGIYPSGIENALLKWERNVTTNIGVDYAFFNNRIQGSVEVFRRLSKDLLLDKPLPYLSGFSNVTSNVGKLKNEGIELEIRTRNIQSDDFSWSTNFNISFLRNRVLRLLGDDKVLPGNQSVRVGYALGTNVTYQYAGVNSATGRPMWYDANGEITYQPSAPNDYKIFGNQLSDFYGGFTNTFQYKGLSLSVFFHYDYGRELSNSGMNSKWYANGGDYRNTLEWIFNNRWTTPGQLTTVPRPYDGNAETNGMSQVSTSSRYLEDASFIRLKNVSLSYQLPKSWTSRLKLSDVKVYAQGENLATWTKWTGYDPELIIDTEDFSSSQGAIPQTRAYTLGVQIGF